MLAQISVHVMPGTFASTALAASRTMSSTYGIFAASSKSFTPHTSRPSASRHVPKFST